MGDEGSELMSDTSKLVQPCHVQPEASPAAQQWNNAEDTWGVVVVHGVGETQPGALIRSVPELATARTRLLGENALGWLGRSW